MSVQSESRHRPNGQKVRYVVVGAGWISQEGFMPGVEQTGNSVMTALAAKSEELVSAAAPGGS
jgi:predicted dehydrogenase